ncbi:MAG: SCP2 sterol-binding domain-containing protein [Oscillospiraceae bacterium]|nr:SCP2 sterol-binding domain-containing protein [Oscillospiraceae bacterium]
MDKHTLSSEMEAVLSQLNEKTAGVKDDFICLINVIGEGSFTLDLSAEGDKLFPGTPDNPEVTIELSQKTMQGLLSGKVHPMVAYSSRKLKVRGDMAKAMKLVGILG